MIKLLLLGGAASLLLMLQAQSPQPQQPPQPARPTAQPPTEFDKYHFVVLMRGDNPPEISPEEAQRIQAEHLGHLRKMHEEGHLLVAGPFAEQFDPAWRGLCLYDGSLTPEKVRELAEADPAVEAGRLKVQIMSWYTEKGVIAFPRSAKHEAD